MSTISASTFRAHLNKWGVRYAEHSRYDRCLGREVPWYQHQARTRSNCAVKPWDAHGIALHHTGGPTSWTFVWDGRTEDNIPGPLYIVEIYEDGVAHLTGWPLSNNAGATDGDVVARVRAGTMPLDREVEPGADDFSYANSELYGVAYRGIVRNAAQRATALRVCAAICDAHGDAWDGGSVAGHKELTDRKPDPEGEDMAAFRRDLNALLAIGPNPQSEDDMPLTDDDKRGVWYDPRIREYTDEDASGAREPRSPADLLAATHKAALLAATPNIDAFADAVIARLPAGSPIDKETVKQGVREVLLEGAGG